MRKMKNVMIKMVMIGFMGLLLAGFVPMTASAEEEAVSYIDADGSTKTITEYTVVTTEMEGDRSYRFVSNSSNGFLYVKNSVVLNGASSDGTGTQNLILGDGATLTINGYMFFNDSLNIFCQSGGTGKLKINANIFDMAAMNIASSYTLTINGGIIEAENLYSEGCGFSGGDFVMNGGTVSVKGGSAGSGIACSYGNTIVYNGGNLMVSGGGDGGIYCDSVTLNYKSSDDRIKVSNYYYSQNVAVTIADGKYFKDESGNFYSGTLTADEITAISGKELRPAYSYAVTIADGITNGTVTATDVVYTTVSESPQTIALEDATVTLTATPASGYELSTLTVTGDTTQEQVTVNGSDNTRTFTMPSENVTVSATFRQIPVKYLDANGTEKSCTNYTVLTGGDYDQIGSGTPEKWYVVNSDIHFDSLLLKGNVNIILVDGQTVTFGYENNPIYSNYGILSEYNNNDSKVPLYDLKIYGQSLGTGALTIYEKSSQESEPESISVYVDEYYQYGGKVTIKNTGNNGIGIKTKGRVELKNNSSLSVTTTGGDAINTQDLVDITNAIVTAEATGTGGCAIYSPNGIRITNSKITAKATGTDGCAIGSDHRISITDSQVTATGANAGIKTDTVSSEGTVALSLSGADNYVQASNYVANTVYAAEGKYLTDEGGNLYGGAVITKQTASDIANKKLIPAYGVGTGSMSHGSVTASPKGLPKENFANLSDADKTVALTITPEASYILSTLTVTGDTSGDTINATKVSENEEIYTFTMPGENVTVSATFEQPSVAYRYYDSSAETWKYGSCESYTALTGGGATGLAEGWYVVPKNKTATYTGTLTLNGNVNLILEDGAKLNVGAENSPIPGIGIKSNGYNLTVYGQSTDAATAGTLKVYSSSNDEYNCGGISLTSARFTLNGGNVLVSSTGNQGNGIYGDDFTMNGGNLDVSSTKHAAIYTFYDITINCGSVSATGYDCGLHAANGSIKINGDSVTASVTGTPGYENPAIYTSNGKNSATNTANSITVNGGNVTANSTIKANGTNDGEGSIILGFSNVADSIKAAGYIAGNRGSVKVAEDKCFCTEGNDSKAYRGTLTSDQLNAIANKKLYPAYGVFIGSVTNGTVSASPEAFAMTDFDSADKTIILTVNPADGYATGIVSYNDGSDHPITPVNGGYSFSMPAKNVTVSATFPKSLAHSDITVEDIADQTYTGSAITPGVTVKDGDETLEQGTDYTVSYKNNVNAAAKDVSAAPTVIISGMGNYGESKEISFTITPKSITGAMITLSDTKLEYNGSVQSVRVTGVTLDGKALTTADYEVTSGSSGTVKNTYTVTVTGKGNYKDTATTTWDITDKQMTVTAPDVTATYDGQAHGIVVNVTDPASGATVKYGNAEGTYDLDKSPAITNVSDSGKTVYFKIMAANYEDYTGFATITISQKPVVVSGIKAENKNYDGTTTAQLNYTDVKFDGEAISDLTVTATGEFKDAKAGTDKDVYISGIALDGSGKDNYKLAKNDQQNKAMADILPAPVHVTKAVEGKTGLKYSGEPQELVSAGIIVGGGIEYALGNDSGTAPADGWNAAVPAGINAGTYYVWYRMNADQNHKDQEPACINVSVARAKPAAPADLYHENATSDMAENGMIHGVDSTMEYSTDNGGTWTDVTGTSITGLGTGDVQVRMKESGNTETGEAVTITIGVTQALTAVNVAGTAKYGETLTASITPDGCAGMSYAWYRDDSEIYGETGKSYILAAEDIGKKISVKATQKLGDTQEISFTSDATAVVTKAAGETEKPAVPVLWTVTKTMITVRAVDGYEYRLGEAGDWQTSGEFTELNANTEYSIYARKSETETQFAGTVSYALTVKTKEDDTMSTVQESGTLSDGTGTVVTESIIEPDVPATTIGNLDTELAESLLTDAEKAAVQNGEKLTLTLDVKNIDSSVSDENKTLVQNAAKGEAGNAVVGLYLDILLQKQVGNNTPSEVKDTNGRMIKATITVPSDLRNTRSSIVRTFHIIRIHDGVATVLASTTATDIPFESDLFSIYALVYSDKSKGTGGGGGTPVTVTCTVRFDMNGKTVADAPAPQSVEQGGTAARPAKDPESEGFTFGGWYREAACENLFDFSTPITADTVIYAKWIDKKAETFTVTFDLNGKPGTAPAAQTVEKDGFAKEPAAPEAEGFTFTGWFTEAACSTKYDFSTPVTADLTLYAGWEAKTEPGPGPGPGPEPEPEPVVVDEGDSWNLYEDASEHEFAIRGISVPDTVANSNAKSKVYYDAKITGSTITVKVTGDRKKAALAANALLEFDLGSAGVVEYALPVCYVKPVFKLSSMTATIKSGKETTLKTTVLVKNADGSFVPYDMTDVQVSGSNFGSVTKGEDGSIEIRTSTARKGKISIVKDAWDGAKAVNLAYTVKGSKKDVLSVDLQGLKTVVLNSNAKGQAFGFDVMFNGASISSSDLLPIVDKKNTGLATISDDGKLVIAYKDGVKNGTYTVTLQSKESKEAKTNVRIRVNGKKLDKAITTRIFRKYDVVTKQSMVVVPNLRDVGGRIERVSVAEEGFTAKLNAAGNIEIDYIGEEKYNVKNLNIGTLTLSLTITGIDDPVTLPLKNVRAKKTTPTAKVGIVTIPAGVTPAEGQVIGTANIVSTYKVSSGMYRTIRPVKSEILGTPKGVTAKSNENDPSEIDIYSISKKNAQVRVKLTYAGGVTKTVTVRVKKK